MSETEPVPAPLSPAEPAWRVGGVRRAVPVVLLLGFAVLTVGRLRGGTRGWFDQVLAAVGLAGILVAVVLVVVTWRTVVTLAPTGIEVRGARRRFYPYASIGRVHRARLKPGGVSLMLEHDRTAVLPAPVAGLGTPDAVVDDAVEQIRRRLSR